MRGAARGAALTAITVLAAAQAVAAAPETKASAAAARGKTAAASSPASSPAEAPVEFTGTLESGKAYAAEVAYDNNALHIWRPLKDVKVPPQHAWTIDWTNLAKFPALKTPATRARPQRFQFKVTGVDVSSGSPMIPWTTIYRCEVLAVEPVAGAPAAAIKRK